MISTAPPTLARPEVSPLRSVLFVGGHDEAAVAASLSTGADAIIIDIEEPRSPLSEEQRVAARAVVSTHLESLDGPVGAGRPQYFVRVQDVPSGHMLRDLRAVIRPGLRGVVIPKVEHAGDVCAVDAMVHCLELEHGMEPGSVVLYPLLETALSLRNAYEIAMASPRVAYIGGAVSRFGDIVRAIGYRWTPEGLESLFLRSKALIDARAAGVRYPISGMWAGAVSDLDGLRTWAEHLRDLGYYGMFLGSPTHIPIVNEVFSPSAEDLTRWRGLVDAVAQASGDEPARFGDPDDEWHVVHRAHVLSAEQGLAWAAALDM